MPRGPRLLATALVAAGLLTGCVGQATTTSTTSHRGHARPERRRPSRHVAPGTGRPSLITEPQAGVRPLLTAIRGARRSVELVMYEDEDGSVDAALAAAEHRGVRVRALLNGGYYGDGSEENQAAYRYLHAHGVAVHWTPSYFALTHEKSLVVDGRAYVLTFNLTPRYYASSRDFGVVDGDPDDVAAIERTFDADYAARRIDAPQGRDLVWSPGSERAQVALIDSARGTLDVYNEEMDSVPIERALAAAARRGVDVRVVMTYDSQWKDALSGLAAAGVHVRTYSQDAPLYIHAKMILTPGRAFLGSENFSYTSLERNRELGISFSAPSLIGSLSATFDADYAGARSYR